jgi:hypothetical protein
MELFPYPVTTRDLYITHKSPNPFRVISVPSKPPYRAHICEFGSRNSLVGIATGYGVRFQVGARLYSFPLHPASYPVGTEGYFPGGEVAGA